MNVCLESTSSAPTPSLSCSSSDYLTADTKYSHSTAINRTHSLDDQTTFRADRSYQWDEPSANYTTQARNDISIHDFSILWTNSNVFYTYSLIIPLIAMFLGFKSPLPSFLNGFIFGIILSLSCLGLIVFTIINKFFKPKTSKTGNQLQVSSLPSSLSSKDNKKLDTHLLTSSSLSSSSSLTSCLATSSALPATSASTKMSGLNSSSFNESPKEPIIYKCWFHLLSNQDLDGDDKLHDKHFKTELVFIRLQGTSLRLSKPKSNKISNRQLSENSYINFIDDRHLDLTNCKQIYLWFPSSVKNKKKYLWVKKYPIILEISDPKSSLSSHHHSHSHTTNTTELILFGRTNRDKEEWYWRLKQAASDDISSVLNLSSQDNDEDSVGVYFWQTGLSKMTHLLIFIII